MAIVGLLESLMTAQLVDDVTDTRSNKTRESWAQGGANIITGFFGGMGGRAMLGQTMNNGKASGARTRISTFSAGVLVLVLAVALGPVVALIPMAALVAVMIFVAWATFDRHSVRPTTLSRMPRSETMVMLSTVVVTVWTHNLATGVVVGVVVAMIALARRVAHMVHVERTVEEHLGEQIAKYTISGELFLASSNDLYTMFDYSGDPQHVVIDLSDSHPGDASTVAALDSVTDKYAHYGKDVEVAGLNQAGRRMRVRLGGMLSNGGH